MVAEMGFRAGPFVLCKDGCCHQRRRNTNFPPHMCSQNDQRNVGIILSHVCWGRTPPPPRHGRKGSPSPNPPPGTATKEGEGGVGQPGFRAIPPCKAIFFLPSPPLGRDEVVIYWTTRRFGDISGSVFYSLFQKNISFYSFFLLIH